MWIAGSQAEPPAVIMDRDADVIRVVEARCGALREGSVLNGVPVRLYVLRGVMSFLATRRATILYQSERRLCQVGRCE